MKRRAESIAEGNGPLGSIDFTLENFKRNLKFKGKHTIRVLELIPDAVVRVAFLFLCKEGGCPDYMGSTHGIKVSGRIRAGDTTLTIDASILLIVYVSTIVRYKSWSGIDRLGIRM
jgi:hypothetical protein